MSKWEKDFRENYKHLKQSEVDEIVCWIKKYLIAIPIEPDTPLQPVKDEQKLYDAVILRDKIVEFIETAGKKLLPSTKTEILAMIYESPEPSSKEQEGDAVGFAEWIMENYWIPDKENKTWMKMIKGKWADYTTEQLYQLYNQSK